MVTNSRLKDWQVTDDELCTLCKKQIETTIHLLYDCERVRVFIKKIYELCEKIQIEYDESCSAFIVNTVVQKPSHIINVICLITKQWIYRCRCMQHTPSIREWYIELEKCYNSDYFNSKRSNSGRCKWDPMYKILDFVANPEL